MTVTLWGEVGIGTIIEHLIDAPALTFNGLMYLNTLFI